MSTCAVGWWLGPSSSCGQVECPRQPECGFADCEVASFLLLATDGTSLQGFITRSSTDRQFSLHGPTATAPWSSMNDEISLRAGASGQKATCSATRLTLSGSESTRASPELALALSTSADAGNWNQVHY